MRLKSLTILLVLLISLNLIVPFVSSISNVDVTTLSAWWSHWSRDRNCNKIDDVLEETSQNSQKVAIFLDYDRPPRDEDIKLLSQLNLTISYVAKYIDTVSLLNVSASLIPVLANLPNVVMVESQPEVHPLLDTSAKSVRARESISYSPNTAWELGYTGKGLVIAVLDTGVDDEHEFLKGKFVAGFDCSGTVSGSDRETNPDDLDGHGTHVASIIMGTGGSRETYKGVAPDAKLVDVKVMRDVGKTFSGQLIRGIEWVIENKNKYNITIINLSIGSDVEDPDGTSASSLAANEAVENGLVVIAAAGNEGPDAQTLTAPGVAEKVICVTALDDMNTINRGDDIIASYSSRGPRGDGAKKPDIAAPGSNIIGAKAAIYGDASNEIIMMSGTSMAAPHVSGVAALILQASPDLSPLEVKQNLLNTTEDKGETGWDADYGWGEMEAYKAVALASNVDFTDFDEPSSPSPLLTLDRIVNCLIFQFLTTGYQILIPGGIITIIVATIIVVTDVLVNRKKD